MAGAIAGGCICGAMRYEARAAPTSPMICHCRTCRRVAAAPVVAWVTFPREAFRFMKGESGSFHSTPPVTRTFCRRCGTPLTYRHADSPETVDVTTCSFDAPEANSYDDGMTPRLSLRARALHLLARREYSPSQLRAKLISFSGEASEVERLLSELTVEGRLSQVRFAKQFVRLQGRRLGPGQTIRKLREAGISEAVVTEVLFASEKTLAALCSSISQVKEEAESNILEVQLQSAGFSSRQSRRFMRRRSTR